jgi:hypothetical protein
MKNEGQVTIFIVLAIVIVLALSLFFVFQGDIMNSGMSDDAGRVYDFVRGCADDVYLDAIYDVGMKGGYSVSPGGSISFGIPLYKMGDRLSIPDIENIEREVAKEFDKRLMECVGDFSSFSNLDVVAQEASSVAEVRDGEIVLDVVYPMVVSKAGRRDSLEDFGKIRVPLRMGLMYEVASEIAKTEDAGNICLTCLAELAEENEFEIYIVDYVPGVIYIIISYEELNGDVFEFSFAMKE